MLPSKVNVRARKGASLIVTLFLLILCSTVGSIILTAATANVGRISERTAYDQRYYKVISAAKLFADEIAGKSIALTVTLTYDPLLETNEFDIASVSWNDVVGAGDTLEAILQKDVYDLYTGGKTSDAHIKAIAEQYWNENFSNIGTVSEDGSENYQTSGPADFTLNVNPSADGEEPTSTVYGRFVVEAGRVVGDFNPTLDSVTHSVTAVFYSDPVNDDGDIPENAYIVRLTCPANVVYPRRNPVGDQMTLTFTWTRDNMQIAQVRGVT